MGEKDKMVPVKSALHLKNEFRKAGKNNLKLILYKDVNHRFQDRNGKSYLPDLMRRISDWIQKV
jgi:dipeptidyl aminopeptidase/acylaminoacyl peptidase